MEASTNATDVGHEDERLGEVRRSLGLGVHAHRLQRGMTITALAFEAGLPESTIDAIESGGGNPSLEALVAVADALEVGVADLFGDSVERPDGGPSTVPEVERPLASAHVVPSEVVWGGDLPPAPWLASVEDTRHIATVPGPPAAISFPAATTAAPAPLPTERARADARAPEPRTDAGAPAATASTPGKPPVGPVAPTAASGTTRTAARGHTVAPRVHGRAAAHGMKGASPYVFVAPDVAARAGAEPAPRTFSDLRTGALAGRQFSSLQDFAIAAVVEGGHPAAAVARVFRVPQWRLDEWVSQSRGRVD